MIAHIYSPAKTAMQSGDKRTGYWVLRYLPTKPKLIEPLMGYTSTQEPQGEVKLTFATKNEAVQFAKNNGIAYSLSEPHIHKRQIKSYADNFRPNRKLPWTH